MLRAAALLALLAGPAVANPLDDRWWGDDQASWLVLPRALMQDMSVEWQTDMARLLDEWNATMFDLLPGGIRPEVTARDLETGRFTEMPRELTDW